MSPTKAPSAFQDEVNQAAIPEGGPLMSCVRTPQVEKRKSQKLLGRKTVEVTETLPRGPLALLTFMLGQDVIPGITKMTKTTIKR